ncbi:MAG TPA: hypothetical protein VFU32_08170 [Ktedonobacterales bacterium]|nr:hypothetical protein [Ktedonobacterales bacterium]
MEMRFMDLRRLLELWAAWYSIGVDGWLFSDESTHICSLELPNPAESNGSASAPPPYLSNPEVDALLLRALNEFGLQCSRLGNITFSRTCTGEEIALASQPIMELLEAEQAFFAGRRLTLFSELRREYGDFGSHTLALELAIQDGQISVRHPALEMNNRRRGFKLDLWDTLNNALLTYEEVFEEGVALGHSLTGFPDHLEDLDLEDEEGKASAPSEETPASADNAEPEQPEHSNHRFVPEGLPFPCLSASEASHLARLSNQVAPTRRARAEGVILTSTHPLRELAALITYSRHCEPASVMQRV